MRDAVEREIAALRASIPRLRVEARGLEPSDELWLDDHPLPEDAIAEALPVDPGRLPGAAGSRRARALAERP